MNNSRNNKNNNNKTIQKKMGSDYEQSFIISSCAWATVLLHRTMCVHWIFPFGMRLHFHFGIELFYDTIRLLPIFYDFYLWHWCVSLVVFRFFRFWKIINARTLPIHIVRACKCFDKCHSIICLVMEICKHTHTNTKRVYSDALLIWLYITLHAMIYNRHHFSFILTT